MPRKAKPASLIDIKKHKLSKKELEERKDIEDSLNVGTDKIDPPEWLTQDEFALEEWNRIVTELKKIDLLTNVDTVILANYCQAYSCYVEAVQIIRTNGMFIEYTNKYGATNTTEHPAMNTMKKNFEIILKCGGELGLTPSSRARLAIKKTEEKEPTELEKMFGGV